MTEITIKNPTSPPFFGGAPYGDGMEVSGAPAYIGRTDVFRPFLFTDARSVLVVLQGQHFNFIPNPSCRTNADGWELTGLTQVVGSPTYQVTVDGDGVANKAALDGIVGEIDGEALEARSETSRFYLVSSAGATLTPAQCPFPISANVTGWRVATGTDMLDSTDSWVGRSFVLEGSGTLRYRDGAGNLVYVGPTTSPDASYHFNPARSSSEWTFSAFFKGRGRARLVMEAFDMEDHSVPESPPTNQNLPVVQFPAEALYDPAKPLLQDEGGTVWKLREDPQYTRVARPPVWSTNPGVLTEQPEEYLLDSGGRLWQAVTPAPSSGPRYTDLGIPASAPEEPLETAPGPSHILVESADPTTNGYLWAKRGAPFYESTGARTYIGRIVGSWFDVDHAGDDWKRYLVQTGRQWDEISDLLEEGTDPYQFFGACWIDARVEVEDADGMRISSLMLDPSEYPVCSYFDGGMVEDPVVDDFIWEGAPNNSVSAYFIDRINRSRWLWTNLRSLVPAGRPFQIFLGDYSRPFIPPDAYAAAPVVVRSGRFTL